MLSISTRAQVWYVDFTIGLLLFLFTIGLYFGYTENFQKHDKGSLGRLLSYARGISSSLVLSGYPNNWNNSTVIRIGIADDQRINSSKLWMLKGMNYSRSKSVFSTPYNYYIHFVNDEDEVLNVAGICGIGNPIVTTNYDLKSAYYYHDASNSFLKGLMQDSLKADVYTGTEITNMITAINGYDFILMENPLLSDSDYNSYKDEIQNFTSNGGLLIIGGNFSLVSGKSLADVSFNNKASQTAIDRNSTINNTDNYFWFTQAKNVLFSNAAYVDNSAAKNFAGFASFDSDKKNAAARWEHGNGTVYFFSSLNANYSDSNFQEIVEMGIRSFVKGTCTPVNLSGVSPKKLVTMERYLIYNSEVVKMLVYVWE